MKLKAKWRWPLRVVLGPLDRDWLVLGSAPNPTIPRGIGSKTRIVCINNAARTSHSLGLPEPALVIRAEAKSWEEVSGLSSKVVLWISGRSLRSQRRKRSDSRLFRTRLFLRITPEDRDLTNALVLGVDIGSRISHDKPSNGIFAICFALMAGARRIVVSGISLTAIGHSYNDLGSRRLHTVADEAALKDIARRFPQVFTSEPELAKLTGLPLIEDLGANT